MPVFLSSSRSAILSETLRAASASSANRILPQLEHVTRCCARRTCWLCAIGTCMPHAEQQPFDMAAKVTWLFLYSLEYIPATPGSREACSLSIDSSNSSRCDPSPILLCSSRVSTSSWIFFSLPNCSFIVWFFSLQCICVFYPSFPPTGRAPSCRRRRRRFSRPRPAFPKTA